MSNHHEYDIDTLVSIAQNQIARDEKYAIERQESYKAKKQQRIHEIITEIVRRFYGEILQEIVEKVMAFFP
jgi:hypothetical protein